MQLHPLMEPRPDPLLSGEGVGIGLLLRDDCGVFDCGVLLRGVSRVDRAGVFFDGVLADAFAEGVFDDARCFLPEEPGTARPGVTPTALVLAV